jgi:DNA-binding PadR family transcriptional regulator
MTRTDILMELLAASGGRGAASPIVGTTRLQKLLFLVEREGGVTVTQGPGFDFTPYKFGPVSKEIYDDLTKLENLEYISSEPVAEPSNVERDEFGLSFEGLMGDEESTDPFEEKRYKITPKGREWLTKRGLSTIEIEKIRKVKGKYGSLSLSDLLHHVYSRYPDMTTASEIKERVLGIN